MSQYLPNVSLIFTEYITFFSCDMQDRLSRESLSKLLKSFFLFYDNDNFGAFYVLHPFKSVHPKRILNIIHIKFEVCHTLVA